MGVIYVSAYSDALCRPGPVEDSIHAGPGRGCGGDFHFGYADAGVLERAAAFA
jgi:hypothetical protein